MNRIASARKWLSVLSVGTLVLFAVPNLIAQSKIGQFKTGGNLGKLTLTSSSQPVRLELNTFRCLNADEDSVISDGDEPFLLPVAIFIDGNTVKLESLATATALLKTATSTHGNLGRTNVRAGDRFAIPQSTGVFTSNLALIDTKGLGDPKSVTIAGIAVIALEQDGTSRSAMDAGYRTLINTLQNELNTAIRALQSPDIAAIQAKVKDAVTKTIKIETLKQLNIVGAVDPNDFVASQFAQFNFGQLETAGPGGKPFFMELRNGDGSCHYVVEGRATMGAPAPPPPTTIGVRISRVKAIDDLEGFGRGDPDFQAKITIDRKTWKSPEKSGETINPTNWFHSVLTGVGRVQVNIELFENDGVLNADEHCDINPFYKNKSLSLFVDRATGAISGDVSGRVGVPITVRGAGDKDRCEITFTVTR